MTVLPGANVDPTGRGLVGYAPLVVVRAKGVRLLQADDSDELPTNLLWLNSSLSLHLY